MTKQLKLFVQITFEFIQKKEKKFRNKHITILSQAWDEGRILSPTRNQTSDLWIPLSDALLPSHRGSIVNKTPYEFHIWHASCILLGSSILLVSHFVYAHLWLGGTASKRSEFFFVLHSQQDKQTSFSISLPSSKPKKLSHSNYKNTNVTEYIFILNTTLNILSFVQIQTKWKITFYQSNTGVSEKRKSPRKTSTLIFGLIFGTPM